jgi:hypothetical protein
VGYIMRCNDSGRVEFIIARERIDHNSTLTYIHTQYVVAAKGLAAKTIKRC